MNKNLSTFWEDTALTIKVALRSSVAKNAASLYIIQFANYFLPLITVPYLVRVLGPAGFGLVAFGQSLIAYFALFVDYGFALSATRKISVERNNHIAVSRTTFSVLIAKSLLCIFGLIILWILVAVIPKLSEVATLLLILYGTVIGGVLFPVWLFQGMERMVPIAGINLLVRLFVVIGIFTMVHRPEDYLLYARLTSLGSIGAGLAGIGVALYMFKLRLIVPSLKDIWQALVEGWTLFLSMASVSLYTVGNAFILGLLTNPTVVGYYSAAEKILKAVLGLLGPISQAVYPRFSKLASESNEKMLEWGKRILPFMGGLGIVLTVILFTSAPLITHLFLGNEYKPSIKVIQVLSLMIFNLSFATIWSTWIMIGSGRDKAVLIILFSAGFINLGLAFLLIPLYKELGIAISWLISETFVNVASFTYTCIHRINPLQDYLGQRKHSFGDRQYF